MKGIIIASHGEMAEGILKSSQLFFGPQPQMQAIYITADGNPDAFQEELRKGIMEVDGGDGVWVFCDILFGTPCNCLGKLIGEGMTNFQVITGVNLAMILQALAVRENNDESIEQIMRQGTESIKCLNSVLASATQDDEEDE